MKILRLDDQDIQTLNMLAALWKKAPLPFDEHAMMQTRINTLFGKIEDDKQSQAISKPEGEIDPNRAPCAVEN